MTEHTDTPDEPGIGKEGETGTQLLAVNEMLRRDVRCMSQKLAEVADRGDRTRLIAYLLTVALFLGAVGWLYERGQENRRLILQEENYLVQQCENNNRARTEEKALWDSVLAEDVALAEAAGIPITKVKRAALDRIQDRIDRAYLVKDCDKVRQGELVLISPPPTGAPE